MQTGARPDDPPYLKAAFSQLGLSEIEGSQDNPKVIEMYAASGHSEVHHDEVAWCAAFIGWCLKQGGLPNTGSLLAKSYASYGTRVSFKGVRVPRGAIAVWTRTGGNHVNFVLDDDGVGLTCIGGNQSNGKGGGVTISYRLKSDGLLATVLPPGASPATKPQTKPKTKPAVQSKTVWAQVGTVGTAILGAATDWKMLAVIVIAALAVFVILERTKKTDIVGWL